MWATAFAPTPAPTGTKFVILHFTAASLPANNRVEVDLGYGTDVFTSADGTEFWTRPINVAALGGTVPVRYVTSGASTGGVTLDKYGRGERMTAHGPPHVSYSNSDPFLLGSPYTEPEYDPFWFCNNPPQWVNAACIPAGDVRRTVARSVGMILTVHDDEVSTCTVTCIGPDLVITAGHCLTPAEAAASSVIFDYATECDGTRPAGYAPRFHKVKRVLRHAWAPPDDWCILQLDAPPGGIGVPAIPMRASLPAVGESVFDVHHPNGAVKKLSPPHPTFATVLSSTASGVKADLDISGGSSGSGLFDAAGRIVGILSHGVACDLTWFPIASVLSAVATVPGGPTARRVMIVFDRSGSMSETTAAGVTKMAEARDAASLFVQLVRAGGGNRLGLVSFSTAASSPPEHPLGPVNPGSKAALVGPPPYSGGVVGGLVADGWTSIGGGLQVARDQLAGPSADPPTILLLTDGMQNTPPMIETVEPTLGGITINAIGFGTESNLNGALLTNLCEAHGGIYTRAGTGLELKKYFALAFGDIFEAGTLVDPEHVLKSAERESRPMPFLVCDEAAVTVVVGWEDPGTTLALRVVSPSGAVVTAATPGVETATGRTWTFLRIPLPQGADREGTWKAVVTRAPQREAAAKGADVRFFVNVLATGGATLRRYPAQARRHHTGDEVNPLVVLRHADGSVPHHARVRLTVTRPRESVGNVLARRGLRHAASAADDAPPSRWAALQAHEKETQREVTDYVEESFDLLDDPRHNIGTFEKSGVFGHRLPDLLKVEGSYTFRAVATYGEPGCEATREAAWTLHVEPGIDAAASGVQTTVGRLRPDGKRDVVITLVPRDKHGNHFGPGRAGDLTLTGTPGTIVEDPPRDVGDGSYEVPAAWDPASGHPPGIVIQQPGRDPVVLCDAKADQRGGGGARRGKAPGWAIVLIVVLAVLALVLLGLLLT